MAQRSSRRTFLKQISYAGLSLPLVSPRLVRAVSANGKVMHASIGAAGMAWSDIKALTRSEHLVLAAVCDVDEERFAKAAEEFPQARRYGDWRELLEKEGKGIDSVNVTVPDHMHAPIAWSAMQLGKHVYCQKPLTHSIFEARQLTHAARRAKVVTQMGIQIHSRMEYRLAVELIRSGVVGKIQRVHSYEGKSWGGTATGPAAGEAVPSTLNWDRWLGVAAERPFAAKAYHPGQWRRWCDFGTGTFGDMGCHILDPVFKSLALTAPVTIRSEGPAAGPEQWPESAVVHFTFPGTAYTAGRTIEVSWYDGGELPPQDVLALLGEIKPPRAGSIFIGTNGAVLVPHVSAPRLLPVERFAEFEYPKLEADDHWMQFVDACRGEGTTRANFDYAGPLTETVLLGTLAERFPGQTLEWDSAAMKVTNVSDANRFIRRTYRAGWGVEGLG